jgi:hypothetical protein
MRRHVLPEKPKLIADGVCSLRTGLVAIEVARPVFRELRLYSSCKGLSAKVEVVAQGNQ